MLLILGTQELYLEQEFLMGEGVQLLLQKDYLLTIMLLLKKLPIKTISQCRWVSKTWYDYILHPLFAQLHHVRAVQNQSICAVFRGPRKLFYLIEHDYFDNFRRHVIAILLKFRELRQTFWAHDTYNVYDVVGCINGLICFSPEGGDNFWALPYYICNPITGEYIKIPLSPHNYIDPLGSGIGFDPISNDYKVICILGSISMVKNESWNEEWWVNSPSRVTTVSEQWVNPVNKIEDKGEIDIDEQTVVEVYSLGSATWKKLLINDVYVSGMIQSTVFVNGCLHWIAYIPDAVILSFNVATEEFKIIQLPPHENDNERGLMIIREHLCFLHGFSCGSKDVWLMTDYGVEDSWTKEYTIKLEYGYLPVGGSHEVIELWNGKLLSLNGEERLGYYDPEKKLFKRITIHNLARKKVELPIFQVGSLISPKNIRN
ncbi:hypothetical protein AQUCO_01400441v1 [Aquilegia coerulea]|uniref:F-box associated beta-propeller type 3 domain-containing protein n=1 Tax=Aquilegia coerulea TaxID=218851 RepID=A0A2G5DWF7_AQUCA|nr:hypothetical protein AQUCO_01400441v1 [Aquilegia coerulea]